MTSAAKRPKPYSLGAAVAMIGTMERREAKLLAAAQEYEKEILALADALKGCPKCDYDEAEGGLVCHCAACQFSVTKMAWHIVHRRHAR